MVYELTAMYRITDHDLTPMTAKDCFLWISWQTTNSVCPRPKRENLISSSDVIYNPLSEPRSLTDNLNPMWSIYTTHKRCILFGKLLWLYLEPDPEPGWWPNISTQERQVVSAWFGWNKLEIRLTERPRRIDNTLLNKASHKYRNMHVSPKGKEALDIFAIRFYFLTGWWRWITGS